MALRHHIFISWPQSLILPSTANITDIGHNKPYYSRLKNSPAMNADGKVIMILVNAHFLQHLQYWGYRVRYSVIWPVHVVQLFQCPGCLKNRQYFLHVFLFGKLNIHKSNYFKTKMVLLTCLNVTLSILVTYSPLFSSDS